MEGHLHKVPERNPVNWEFYIQRKYSSKIMTVLHKENWDSWLPEDLHYKEGLQAEEKWYQRENTSTGKNEEHG